MKTLIVNAEKITPDLLYDIGLQIENWYTLGVCPEWSIKETSGIRYSIHLSLQIVKILRKVVAHCRITKDEKFFIRDLTLSKGEYTNISKLEKFGFCTRIYNTKGGLYIADLDLIGRFIWWRASVPSRYDVTDNGEAIMSEEKISIYQVPKMTPAKFGEYFETLLPSFVELKY